MNITTIIAAVTISAATVGYLVYQNNQHQQVQADLKQQIEVLNEQVASLTLTKSKPEAGLPQSTTAPSALSSTSSAAKAQLTASEAPLPRELANVDRRLIEQHTIKRIEELAKQGKNPDVLFQKGKKKGEADL
jgi:cell division septum initiation protein DivIVA